MVHWYTTYGLIVQSDIPFPELLPASTSVDSRPDVVVRLGAVPEALTNPTGRGVLYQAAANQFLLNLSHVARYLVQNGDEIVVQPAPGSLESDVRLFLLGSCCGALLHQRGMLALHASGLWTERGAVLFMGPSGAGKSTLLGEFLRRGYSMLVDDVCAIVLDETGTPVVLPAFPRTRLWADAATKLERDTGQLVRTRPGLEKYDHQIPEQFHDRPAPIRHIYRLVTHNREEMALKPLARIYTFSAVLNNTYRHVFLEGLEMRAPHFKLASAVAACAPVTSVSRPSGSFQLAELADLIERSWDS